MASPPPPPYGPPTQPGMPPVQPPPPVGPPPGFGPPGPGGPPPPPFGSSPIPPSSPPPKRGVGALWVVLGAVVVAALVAGAIVLFGGGGDDDADSPPTSRVRRTTEPRDTTTTTTTTEPTTEPSTTTTTSTTVASTTTVATDGTTIDLGHGVTLPIPDGWSRTDGPDDEVAEISNDTLSVTAQAVSRDAGENPLGPMQEYVDLFDGDFASVSYSPATLRGTFGDNDELRNYGLYYRAIDSDYTGFDGAVYVLQRNDGLTVLLDYYSERGAESQGLPDDDWEALLDSILGAPSQGDPVDVPAAEPFRVTSMHPYVAVSGLAGYTLPPGWVDASQPGATILNNGLDETVVAIHVTGQASADAAAAAVQADFAARYPGFVFEAATSEKAWANLERRDIVFDGPADPAIDPRPRTGAITVFFDPATGSALSHSRFWYADVASDGSDPNIDATDFMFQGYTDSFDTIP